MTNKKETFLRLPSSRSTTWKNQSVRAYRKPDLLRVHMPAELFQFSRQHISKNCRCQTCCIRIYQEKQRLIAENLCTQLNQVMDTILNLPDLPLRSTSIRRRIHNDCIIMIPSANLTLNKLHTVIHQPADRSISQTGSNRILLRPGNHTLRSIHMSNRSSRCCFAS